MMAEQKAKVEGTFEITKVGSSTCDGTNNGGEGKSKETVEDFFYHYTSSVGSLVRQLALAGIAVIWLLHKSEIDVKTTTSPGRQDAPETIGTVSASVNVTQIPLDSSLKLAAFLIIAGLFTEALQYFSGSICWSWEYSRGRHANPITQYQGVLKWLFFLVIVKSLSVTIGLFAIGWYLRGLVF